MSIDAAHSTKSAGYNFCRRCQSGGAGQQSQYPCSRSYTNIADPRDGRIPPLLSALCHMPLHLFLRRHHM